MLCTPNRNLPSFWLRKSLPEYGGSVFLHTILYIVTSRRRCLELLLTTVYIYACLGDWYFLVTCKQRWLNGRLWLTSQLWPDVWPIVVSFWFYENFSAASVRSIALCLTAFFGSTYLCKGGTRWCSWLRHCATKRKVTGSIPDGIGIFH